MTERPIEFERDNVNPTVIKVVGVGGGGGNALRRMVEGGLRGVEFIAVNTDVQVLHRCPVPVKIAIGKTVTRGLGSGCDPAKARAAAEEDIENLKQGLAGADMVFLAAGLGKGTGTGATPVIARLARDMGALVVAIVTWPFDHEGLVVRRKAEKGLAELREVVDTVLVVHNQHLLRVAGPKIRIPDAYLLADSVLHQGVQGISDIITQSGDQNVDFADVRTVMANQGDAILATATASGEKRVEEAVKKVVTNQLLATRPEMESSSIQGARNLLVNITYGSDFLFHEEVALRTELAAHIDAEALVVSGLGQDDRLADDEIRVTVIATGFDPVSMPLPEEKIGSRAAAKAPEVPEEAPKVSIEEDAPEVEAKAAPEPVRLIETQALLDDAYKAYVVTEDALEPPAGRPGPGKGSSDEFEIPAYLRRGVSRP